MALTNEEFLTAIAPIQDDFQTGAIDQAAFIAAALPLYNEFVQGGASVATAARLSAEAITALNTFLREFIDVFAGAVDGGPGGDGLYPVTDAAGNNYSFPSLARLIADFAGMTPKGSVADVESLPSEGNKTGDFYTVAGVGDAPNRLYGWNGSTWVDLGVYQGEKGDAATIAVGAVATGNPGTDAEVTNSGNENEAVFHFTIPRGDAGAAATIAVGDVTTSEPGSDATVENSGSSSEAVFDFEIPQGDKGEQGDGLQLDATGTFAGRDTYDAEAVGFVYLSTNGEDGGGGPAVLYVREGASGNWSAAIPFQGDAGREVELQSTPTHMQWRYVGDPSWTNLFEIQGDAISPLGEVAFFAVAPTGDWIEANGQALETGEGGSLRQTLIDASYPFGQSGSDPKVPDVGGRVIAGKEATATRLKPTGIDGTVTSADGATVGATGGADRRAISRTGDRSPAATGANIEITTFIDGIGVEPGNGIFTAARQSSNVQPTIILHAYIRTEPLYAAPVGPQGDSAFTVAVDEGFVGNKTAWLASLVGEPGPPGAAGFAQAESALRTANFTATAGKVEPCDTTGGAFTVTLPASPSSGALCRFIDATWNFATTALTFDRNGEPINGVADDFEADVNGVEITFTYINASRGWNVTASAPLAEAA